MALASSVYAQVNEFVYTNNNPQSAQNSVSGFLVGPDGVLTPTPGSPFLTGGTGSGDGQYAAQRITSSNGPSGGFLFVANDGSNDVSVFQINLSTGSLTLVGSPFSTGGTATVAGMSLAVTPNRQFLYAANGDSNDVTTFAIASNGALTIVGTRTPLGSTPDGIKISPSGKFLSIALPYSNSIAMFAIDPSGGLTAVPGSPFSTVGFGLPSDVEINCSSNLLFSARAADEAVAINVFAIGYNGALSSISGSPFNFPGDDASVVVLSPDKVHLFVSQYSDSITALNVATGGGLTQVSGSPFPNGGGMVPSASGVAINHAGTLVYVANFFSNKVTGFHIDANGGLTPVTGSPFQTVPGMGLESLTLFPSASCN